MSNMAEKIEEALARIEDFESVQRGADPEALPDAVLCLQAAVGIDDGARVALRDGLENLERSGQTGPILLGLVIGLLAADVGPVDAALPDLES
jgi:hypothetical protein